MIITDNCEVANQWWNVSNNTTFITKINNIKHQTLIYVCI
jgi:hypothetical protein